MTAYLASYLPAIQSLLPRWSPTTAPLPELGSQAPNPLGTVDLSNGNGQPTLVAFVRHCGCPFAEKEVKLLGEELKRHPQLHVIIVQHSEQSETEAWLECIGGKQALPDASRYTLVADPEREIYAAWGIGQLGWTQMVNGEIMASIKELNKEGIDLTPTGKGSWRWQNSGGFAVDGHGKIQWRKIAENSADMCNYAEAARAIV